MPADSASEVVITAAEYDALRDIAKSAQWARDCRNVFGLEDQFEAAMDDAGEAIERWEVGA